MLHHGMEELEIDYLTMATAFIMVRAEVEVVGE